MIQAGKLDRRITIQTKTETRGAAGGVTTTWGTLAEVWAEKVSTSGREFRAAQGRHLQVQLVLRIRYYSGLSENTHQILFESRSYNIVGIEEEGRREGMLLACVYTEGEA